MVSSAALAHSGAPHSGDSPCRTGLQSPDRRGGPPEFRNREVPHHCSAVFSHAHKPREWSLAPLSVIGEAVEKIRDGTIACHAYDPDTVALSERS